MRDGEEASPYACAWRSKLVVAKLNGHRFACGQQHRFRNGTSARQQMDFSGLVGAQAANGTYRNDPTHRACMSRWPKFNLRGANARGNGLQRNFRFGWWCSHVGTRRLSDRERPRLLPGGTERCRTIAFGQRRQGSDEALPGMGNQAHAVSCYDSANVLLSRSDAPLLWRLCHNIENVSVISTVGRNLRSLTFCSG